MVGYDAIVPEGLLTDPAYLHYITEDTLIGILIVVSQKRNRNMAVDTFGLSEIVFSLCVIRFQS